MSFDEVIDRKETNCIKYDRIEQHFGKKDLKPFWIADMDFKVPTVIIEAISERLKHPVFGYTSFDNTCFYDAVSYWFGARFSTQLHQKTIHPAPSVLFTITEIIRRLTNVGDPVIINMPSYNNFIHLIKGNERVILEAPLLFENGQYEFDLEGFTSLCQRTDTKVFLLCNPHNPTGYVFKEQLMAQIINICYDNNVFLLSDEIHMDFVRTKEGHQSLAKWVDKYDHIALVTCLGKTFNISGLSHSYYITSNTLLSEAVNTSISQMYGLSIANPLTQEAIKAAYNHCGAWVDDLNDYIESNVNLVLAFIDEHLSDTLEAYRPDATFLMWISFEKSGFSEELVHQAFKEYGKIAVGIGSSYELCESHHFRLNIGCPRTQLMEGLECIKKAFDAYATKFI